MDTKIFVMTHKRIAEIPDDIYIPLQVGKAGKEDFGYLGDDTGENISEKNANYCELTGMYWIWKNMKCDVVGICHYRRYFVREEKLLTKGYIEQKLQEYSIIIPSTSCVRASSVYTQYEKVHDSGKDLLVCREVIAEKYPEYLQAFDFSMKSILVSVGNMWITRKEMYDSYCEWLFDILFEVEKRIDITGYDDYQKRVMGFLSERLFRAWLLMQPEKITEEQVKMIDPADFQNAEKKVDLLYKYIKLKMQPVLNLYKRNEEPHSLAYPKECRQNFEGKIPVWLNWWQGEQEMPELIRCCYESLKRNLPEDKVTIRLITLENCMEYVTFTETIIRKFNEGKIAYVHLSDAVRAELLYRYGGMWIDTTYYAAYKIPENIFSMEHIYTLRFAKPVQGANITQGRWSGNLWYTPKGKKLFQFLMECIWYHWENENQILDYSLMDYIIAIAVEEFPEVREELEACAYCEGNVFELQKMMNLKYTPERMQRIQEDSIFYKLNCHVECQKTNLVGEQTVYGRLLEEMSI